MPQVNDLACEVAREQEVVDRALARLEVLRAVAAQREKDSLYGTGAGTPQAVYERDVQALAAASRRQDLDAAGEGLVFGRLDVLDGTVLHIGRIGMRTEDQEPIVVDWRAPAAAPFYQATAADPLGVVRRRTISCRGPLVVGVEDELIDPEAQLDGTIVGDGAFLAAVSRERGPHMRDIVATIQREQDLAVRAPDDGALVVMGGPGTGKTAVALHRVAYLMYARREWYSRRGVLVVGPSPVFVDYIGAVLPSLGETSVRLSDLGGLPVLPRGLTRDGDDDAAAVAVKGSARMVPLLKRAIRHLSGAQRVRDLEIVHWGHTFEVSAEEQLNRRAQAGRSPRSHNAGRTAYVASLVEVCWRIWERRPNAPRTDPGDREDFGRWLRSYPDFVREVDRAWPVLEPLQVLEALRSGAVPLAKIAGGLYDAAEQSALSRSWPSTSFSAADTAVFDELVVLLGPPPEPEVDPDDAWDELTELDALASEHGVTTFADRNRGSRVPLLDAEYHTYAHVVVDEAQDVTPMQWRMLGRRARGATWTIVGDWAQSAWPDVSEVRRAMDEVLGKARLRSTELTTNYRTSTEIAALASRVLHRIDPAAVAPAAVRSTGFIPRWVVAQDVALALPAVLTDLLAEVSGTVGVVVPRALRGIRFEDPRVAVVDTWQVKGLEYDGCVVLAPELIVAEALTEKAGLRTLYVALTRATQRLVVVSTHAEAWLD